MTIYPVIKVDRSLAKNLEHLGNKRKFWFPREDDTIWLFKAEERETGEDWAEKIACELCHLLGVPHVHYELASEVESNIPGSICPNIAPPPLTLVLGNQLLFERDAAYPSDNDRKYKVREHTVDAVANVVRKLSLPPTEYCQEIPSVIENALDVLVGYLMVDTLIANQDRHHQNWGALREANRTMLAPTFDHGAALARNEPEEKRHRRLYGPDKQYSIENFASKARSSLYESDVNSRPLTTIEAFIAFAKLCPKAAQAWLERLRLLENDLFEQTIARIPSSRISETAREFTLKLLLANQRRLLETEQHL